MPPRSATESTISRAEVGAVPHDRSRVAALLRWYGLNKAHTGTALDLLASETSGRGIVNDSGIGWPGRIAACERVAHHIRIYALHYLPQLLQTPAYTDALREGGVTPGYSPDRVLAPGYPSIDLLTDRSTLERPVGGPQVMAGQLRHLQRIAAAGKLRIRIIPRSSGVFLPMTSELSELWFSKQRLWADESVCVNYAAGPLDGAPLAMRLDEVAASSLPEQESDKLIAVHRSQYEQQAWGGHDVPASNCAVPWPA